MYVSGDIFTIEPTTQYVWINEIATFECAINDTGYTLGFSLTAPATGNVKMKRVCFRTKRVCFSSANVGVVFSLGLKTRRNGHR